MRKPHTGDFVSTLNTFKNAATMFVVHENSFSPYHAQSDHLSYSFYYKGMPFLIDPGYRVTNRTSDLPAAAIADESGHWNYGRQWMRSIYAHNMVLVDPDNAMELWELRKRYWDYHRYNEPNQGLNDSPPNYRPFSAFINYNDMAVDNNDIVRDPCYLDYYQQSDNLDLLRTNVVYDDQSTNMPKVQLKRSFLRYDDLFLVLDDIDALDNSFHQYSSLYQFGVFNRSIASVDSTAYGFRIQKGVTDVDLICGSTGVYGHQIDDATKGFDHWYFPTSRKFTSSPDSPLINYKFGHARGRTMVVDAGDTSILTIIAPQDASNPVSVLNNAYEPYVFYGVELSQNTRSLPIQPVSRYFGCTNGSQQSLNFGENEIRTNGKLFATSVLGYVQPLVLNQSIVIQNGSNLEFNGIMLYEKHSGEDDGFTAEYSDTSLKVVFHGESFNYPRFRVYNSGTNPELFTAIIRTPGAEPFPYPDESDFRYISTDIIQSLAYDDQYFYVNYTWDDLIAADLIDASLVMVKGIIPEALLTADLRIQGDIQLVGDLTIAAGASMHIGSNSNLLAADGVMIANHGSLIIDGGVERSISLSKLGQQWTGIATFRDGNLSCDGAVIDGAETGILIRGAANVSNSKIFNCSQGVCVETQADFTVVNSIIHDNTYGVISSNNYSTSQSGYIECNEIYENGIGILMYNSNTNLANNDIHTNRRAGLHLLRGSEPLVKYCNISFTEYDQLARPEIRLESDSYPILDEAHNDINADGIGHSLYYTPGGFAGCIKPLKATYNFWGSTDYSTIREWIYPEEWEVTFAPFCVEPNTSFTHEFDTMFKQALAAEESGDIAYARQLYTLIVATQPDSLHALQSLGRLNSIYAGSPDLISELRGIYDSYMIACSDSVLVKSAEIKLIMLDRFDGLYQQALQGYNNQLQQAWTDLDSLLCLLDIAYTMQDMYYDDLTKGSHTGISYHSNGLYIASLKDAQSSIEQLWGELMTRSDEVEIEYAPVPVKLDVMNYPNPFNPSTTIAFSHPNEGIVRVSIFNLRGQRVSELINSEMPRGFHKVVWDGKDSGNRSVSSGVYFVRIETGKTTAVRKIMLMK